MRRPGLSPPAHLSFFGQLALSFFERKGSAI